MALKKVRRNNYEYSTSLKQLLKFKEFLQEKARLVADLFRGKDVKVALGILNNTNKKASQLFIKLLNSFYC